VNHDLYTVKEFLELTSNDARHKITTPANVQFLPATRIVRLQLRATPSLKCW